MASIPQSQLRARGGRQTTPSISSITKIFETPSEEPKTIEQLVKSERGKFTEAEKETSKQIKKTEPRTSLLRSKRLERGEVSTLRKEQARIKKLDSDIKKAKDKFEKEVAEKAPKYADPARKALAITQATTEINRKIDSIQSNINSKEGRVDHFQDKEGRTGKDFSKRIQGYEDDIDELKEELKGWREGLKGDENKIITGYYSGYTKDYAKYLGDVEDAKNDARTTSVRQQEEFAEQTLKDLRAADPNVKIVRDSKGKITGIESPKLGQSIPLPNLDYFFEKNIDSFIRKTDRPEIFETSLAGFSPASQLVPSLKEQTLRLPKEIIQTPDSFFRGTAIEGRQVQIKDISQRFDVNLNDAGRLLRLQEQTGEIIKPAATKIEIKRAIATVKGQEGKPSLLEGFGGLIIESAARKSALETQRAGALARDKKLAAEGRKLFEESKIRDLERSKDIKKFVDTIGTGGALVGGSLLGAGVKGATSLAGEVISRPDLSVFDADAKKRIEKNLELNKQALIQAGLGTVQGFALGTRTGGIIPKSGGIIKRVAGTALSLEKPAFAIGEFDEFKTFQRINNKMREQEARIVASQAPFIKKAGAVAGTAAVGFLLPDTEVEATTELGIEALVGGEVGGQIIKRTQRLIGGGSGFFFGGSQIASAKAPSEYLQGLATVGLGAGGFTDVKSDIKTKSDIEKKFKEAEKRAKEQRKASEKLAAEKFKLLPDTFNIQKLDVSQGTKLDQTQKNILVKQLKDLNIAKTDTEALNLISSYKKGKVTVDGVLPETVNLFEGSLKDVKKVKRLGEVPGSPGLGETSAEFGVISFSQKTPFGAKEINYIGKLSKTGRLSIAGELQILSAGAKGKTAVIKAFKKAPVKTVKYKVPGQPPIFRKDFDLYLESPPIFAQVKKQTRTKPEGFKDLEIVKADVELTAAKFFPKRKTVSPLRIPGEIIKPYTGAELKILKKQAKKTIETQQLTEIEKTGKTYEREIAALGEFRVGDAKIAKSIKIDQFITPFAKVSFGKTKRASPIQVERIKLPGEQKPKTKKTPLSKTFTNEIKAANKKIFQTDKGLQLEQKQKPKPKLKTKTVEGTIAIPKDIKLRTTAPKRKTTFKDLETKGLIKTKIDTKPAMKLQPRVSQKLKSDTELGRKFRQQMNLKQNLKLSQKLDQKLEQKLDTKLDTKLDLRLKSELRLDLKPETKIEIRPEIKIELRPGEDPLKRKLKTTQKIGLKKGQEFFIPEAKRNNKWVKLSKQGLTKQAALGRGARVVDNTVAGRFRIKPANKGNPKIIDNYYSFHKAKFRDYKIRKGERIPLKSTLIERKGKGRIDTAGERKGLTIAKYLKKQGLAGRTKKAPKLNI